MLRLLLGILVLVSGALTVGAQTSRFPDTSDGIHVFNDQIDLYSASNAFITFVAMHYDGTQKIPVDQTRRLREVNPDFVVLHYRLGYGLGYRVTDENCQPTGDYLLFMDGVNWVREWTELPEDYFYHVEGERLLMCDWGWLVMDTDNAEFRGWWLDQIRAQLAQGEYDGLFADSVSLPNTLGTFRPALPALDERFEADWTRRLNDWMTWLNGELDDEAVLIPNAGAWVTTRDQTDYSLADGVMIEGFAGWGWSDRFAVEDWELQLNRALSLIGQDKIVIAQSYVEDFPDQLWVLANFLLIKGSFTYINIDIGQEAEWFPIYDLPIGEAIDPVPTTIADLYDPVTGLYTRHYANALVLVNPDPAGQPRSVLLPDPMHLITGQTGGGVVPADANIEDWTWTNEIVQEVSVAPGQAAILLLARTN